MAKGTWWCEIHAVWVATGVVCIYCYAERNEGFTHKLGCAASYELPCDCKKEKPMAYDGEIGTELRAKAAAAITMTKDRIGDHAARKAVPLVDGVMDYFPDALISVAQVSHAGNAQHNPGEPLHWARGKSNDHANCIARHMLDRGTFDTDGQRHSAKLAWRALALLQLELEADLGLPMSRGSTAA